MSAGQWNAVAEQGTRFNPILMCKDSTGAPVNLSGYTARMQVRESYDANVPLFDLTTENGGIILGGAGGTIALLVTEDQLARVAIQCTPGLPPVKICVHDLELYYSGAGDLRLVQGTFIISRGVTRR